MKKVNNCEFHLKSSYSLHYNTMAHTHANALGEWVANVGQLACNGVEFCTSLLGVAVSTMVGRAHAPKPEPKPELKPHSSDLGWAYDLLDDQKRKKKLALTKHNGFEETEEDEEEKDD